MKERQEQLEYMSGYEMRKYKRALRIQRERRRKFFTAIVAVILTLSIVICFSIAQGAIRSNANTGFKYFTQYLVEPGDTLWDIADEYIDYDHYKNKKTYLEEVRSINRFSEDENIYIGQTIILPYYSSEYVY